MHTLPEQKIGELPGVAQAEVEALAGDRVQRLRRVADPHFATFDQCLAHAQSEREAAALAGLGESHAAAELGLQGGNESVVVKRHNGIGLGRRQREHDGEFIAQR